MDKKSTPNDPAELTAFRQKIDEIDDKIFDLLTERMKAVTNVGELKQKHAPGQYPLRPGREADMVRRIIKKCNAGTFPATAAAALWRLLIGTSTATESSLKVSVFAPDRNDELYWLTHEYFGPSAIITKQPHVKRVIGDLIDGKAAVGVLPFLRSADTSDWWTHLLQPGKDAPKLFAHIPFCYTADAGKNAPAALAIGRIAPEATEDDMSLLVLETDHNVSQSRLQTLFTQARLEVNWITIATIHPSSRHHLISAKGFITADHTGMKSCLTALGSALLNTIFLGAYAVPIILKQAAESKPQVAANAPVPTNA